MLAKVVVAPETSDHNAARVIVDRARHRGFTRFALPSNVDLGVAPAELFFREAGTVRRGSGGPPIPLQRVGDAPGLQRAIDTVGEGGVLAIEWTADRVIPLESAVASRGRKFELWTFARRPSEVPAALGALEHGADLVFVAVRSVDEVDQLEHELGGQLPSGLAWSLATVREVRPAGVGDRVIVDTTNLLAADEGLVVGSSAGFLFHVASEAVGSAFSRPRPFRVNAGAAHSYVLLADGSTRYLAELEANDAVLVAAPRGGARAVRVGRIKVERRPLLLVRAEVDGHGRTVFLQEAETVRLSTEAARVASTDVAPGTRVWGVHLPPARHLGAAIEETIDER